MAALAHHILKVVLHTRLRTRTYIADKSDLQIELERPPDAKQPFIAVISNLFI